MTNRTHQGLLVLAFATTLSGCGGGTSLSPTAPSKVPSASSPPPPGPVTSRMAEVTLSGVVYELTAAGIAPIAGAAVYCEPCGAETHSWSLTDSNGFYSFFGVWLDAVPTRISVGKEGFVDPPQLPKTTPPNPSGPGWREVRVDGDTRFDIELVRR